ncbi:MAG TPA: DUF6797 domain-containing protein [Verrucomicrobiae bacterium]
MSRFIQFGLLLIAVLLLGATLSARAAETNKPWSDFVEKDFPFFSSVLEARNLGAGWPTNNLTPRGLILNLGHDCWACFDTDLLRVSAIWTGTNVTPVAMSYGSYQLQGYKIPEGQKKLPEPVGKVWLANGLYPGWQTGETVSLTDPRELAPDEKELGRGPLKPEQGQFKAVRQVDNGVVLEYTVMGAQVQERITIRKEGENLSVARSFKFDRVPQALWLVLGQRQPVVGDLYYTYVTGADGKSTQAAKIVAREDGLNVVQLQPSSKPVSFQVLMSLSGSALIKPVSELKPSASRWPQTITTTGKLSIAKDAYVLDDIPIPDRNPWKRNVRFADLAFFPDGRAAFVTFDGDVWLASGLHGDLKTVEWKRFASGLHEPLGLAIRNNEIFVNDRNGLWRLQDTDNNREADVHELFCNLFAQTAETREFAAGVRVAPDGSFVISKGGQQGSTIGKYNGTVLRIAPDGKSFTMLGYGFREPFIGMHPKTGLVTVSDQQGNYVPTTPLYILKTNEYHGFLTHLLPKEQYPAPIADPLTWIPHPVNSSAVGQVWLADAKMGPLNDAFIHIGYNRPELFLVRLNERGAKPQAAVMSLFRDFKYAPINGAVNPIDGQLYVTGMQIWGSTATNISGLTRVRYSGASSSLPREIVPMDKGVLVRFDVPVNSQQATNPASFSVERWNYKRTPAYGSPHFKLDGTKGTETMIPSSAYISKDGKTVFLGVPDMKPVMQMRMGWSLAMQGGTSFANNAYFTPYELTKFDPVKEGFEPFTVDLTPRTMAVIDTTPITAEEGAKLSELLGCVACHSTDGTTLGKVGPSWKGIFGSQRELSKGKVLADEAYLRESIKDPPAKLVKGFEKSDAGMPSYEGVITESQIEALVLYLKTLK